MATQVQNRRGTTAEHSTFTGANGELTVDTTKRTLVVHDGATAGGRPLLREDQSNLPTSAPTTGIYNASGSLAISTGGSGRLFVDASGNIGLGTSAPNVRLDVTGTARIGTSGSVDFTLDLGRSGVGTTRSAFLNGNSGNVTFSNQENGFLSFHTNNTERLRITSAGLLGVGTSVPVNLLDVDGGVGVSYTGGLRAVRDQYTTNNAIVRHQFVNPNDQLEIAPIGSSPTSAIAFRTATGSTLATRMFISSAGNVGVGTTSPGATLDVRGLTRVYADAAGTGIDIIGRSADNQGILRFVNNAVAAEIGRIAHYGNDLDIRNFTANSIVFATNSTERARTDSSGRLLVGTSTPSTNALLQVEGTARLKNFADKAALDTAMPAPVAGCLAVVASKLYFRDATAWKEITLGAALA